MTEQEKREVVLRAAEGGAFEPVAQAWLGSWSDAHLESLGLRDALYRLEHNASARMQVWDDYLTGEARAIAEKLLGEPFDFPSWREDWQSVAPEGEDPLWTAIFESDEK